MNSFAVLDSPELGDGVQTRSRQRRKSKGKSISAEESFISDVQSPKSARKKREKEKGPVADALEIPSGGALLQEEEMPSISKREAGADEWPPSPSLQRRQGFVGAILDWISTRIFQYNVTFGLYMLDRWERWLFNICAFSLIFAVGYSSYKIVQPYAASWHGSLENLLQRAEAPE